MKKKTFKPNLPEHAETSNDKTGPSDHRYYSANEDLYNKFIEEERIDISMLKPANEKGEEAKNSENDSNERAKKWKEKMEELIRK